MTFADDFFASLPPNAGIDPEIREYIASILSDETSYQDMQDVRDATEDFLVEAGLDGDVIAGAFASLSLSDQAASLPAKAKKLETRLDLAGTEPLDLHVRGKWGSFGRNEKLSEVGSQAARSWCRFKAPPIVP
jgi:hypothetical protein